MLIQLHFNRDLMKHYKHLYRFHFSDSPPTFDLLTHTQHKFTTNKQNVFKLAIWAGDIGTTKTNPNQHPWPRYTTIKNTTSIHCQIPNLESTLTFNDILFCTSTLFRKLCPKKGSFILNYFNLNSLIKVTA